MNRLEKAFASSASDAASTGMRAVGAVVTATALAAGSVTLAPAGALAQDMEGSPGIVTLAADAGYYKMQDNYFSFGVQLALAADGGYSKVKVCTNFVGESSGKPTEVPVSLQEIIGYEETFFNTGPKVRDIGYVHAMPVVFPNGSDIDVKNLNFFKTSRPDAVGATVTVEERASVRFSRCSFSNTPVVNGAAVFEDCVFETGEIENNGQAVYTGSTQEPSNIGQESPYQALSIRMPEGKTFPAVVTGASVRASLPFEVNGTAADSASVVASLADSNGSPVEGLFASFEGGAVVVEGEAPRPGVYHVTLSATAQGQGGAPDAASETLALDVQEKIQVKLEGELQSFVTTVGMESPHEETVFLKLFAKEGDGSWMPWNEFATAHDGASVDFSISPGGSGMQARVVYDSVAVSGAPGAPGAYEVVATVTSGARTESSNPVELRIHSNDMNLKERFEALPEHASSWDMEPYTIAETGNAVIPAGLSDIYGSHESGVYGIIGKGEKGNFATETLTVPAGCAVTIHNMKIYSSVRIVVEQGGMLTLDDSVAYGPVDVNGGTLSARNSASFVNRVSLHDGSVLKDAEIVSHAYFLTDGNSSVQAPLSPVLVDGTVTFAGVNSIKGEDSVAGADGQTGLVVQGGTVVVPEGSELTVQGGKVLLGPDDGGAGMLLLDDAKVEGAGKLNAFGGSAAQGITGHGVAGSGTIDVGEFVSSGTAPGVTLVDGSNAAGNDNGNGSDDSGSDVPAPDGDGSATPPADAADGVLTVPVEDGPAFGDVLAVRGSDGSWRTIPKTAMVEGGLAAKVAAGAEVKVVRALAGFPDTQGMWYGREGAVDFVFARGILTGLPQADGTFRFEGDMGTTRAMFVTMLHRLESEPEADSANFADMDGFEWFARAAAWGSKAGVVNGYGDGSVFGGDDAVTREQMAVFMMRYAQSLGLDTSARADLSGFSDADEVSAYAADAMGWAVAEGLLRGHADGSRRLAPLDGASRAETSTVIMRLVNGMYE